MELTPEQLEELKESIKKEILEEIILSDPQPIFKAVREKWIINIRQKTIFDNLFGPYDSNKLWDRIRPIVCVICDCNYQKQIKDIEFAEYAAEEICQRIHDLRMEFLDRRRKGI